MQKITPFLWFDHEAEEAMLFYTSIFKQSKVKNIRHYGKEGPGLAGSFMMATIDLEGQEFIVLNGGPVFTFSPAISLVVNCETQKEVDELWERLSSGGEQQQCGWLRDKFGVTWQIIPTALEELMHSHDIERTGRVMQAMLQMHKLDIAALQRAYDG